MNNEEKCPTNARGGWALLELTDAVLLGDSRYIEKKLLNACAKMTNEKFDDASLFARKTE